MLNQGQTTQNWKLKSQIHQQLWSNKRFIHEFLGLLSTDLASISGLLYSFMVQTDSLLEHACIYKNHQNWPHKHVIISAHQGVSNNTFATLLRSTKAKILHVMTCIYTKNHLSQTRIRTSMIWFRWLYFCDLTFFINPLKWPWLVSRSSLPDFVFSRACLRHMNSIFFWA